MVKAKLDHLALENKTKVQMVTKKLKNSAVCLQYLINLKTFLEFTKIQHTK